jgi:hypothetical protein
MLWLGVRRWWRRWNGAMMSRRFRFVMLDVEDAVFGMRLWLMSRLFHPLRLFCSVFGLVLMFWLVLRLVVSLPCPLLAFRRIRFLAAVA